MSSAPEVPSAEHEALIQFLYLAPVGLVQTDNQGEVAMMNPLAAQLLMPLSRDGGLDNLFVALEKVAPELRSIAARHTAPYGKVCDGLHLYLDAGSNGKPAAQVLALTLLKLDAKRHMAVISDVTEQLRRERRLRQNDAWRNAVLAGIEDYALVNLDLQGRICDWNPSIERVTGVGPEAVGQPYTIFHPAPAIAPAYCQERLREADVSGWSFDEGQRVRDDGSQFWGSTLIVPLPDRDPLPGEADGPAYCLILRDLGQRQDTAGNHEETANAA